MSTMEAIATALAVVFSVPMTGWLLRRVRDGVRRDLQRRVALGDIIAGAPANLVGSDGRLGGSGVLVLASAGDVRWEPDDASQRRFKIVPLQWDGLGVRALHLDRRALTGEKYGEVTLGAGGTHPVTLVVFAPVGTWR